ncbi:DUF427 domain-containing protein [Methylobacterium sp. Leaf118]|uniref:DUF427 domain-containing protein n=1 Tax=Methylobacterium sp. Leaf118 TaxID=2876562 RepID=UPI001E5594C7|nr:DUF427 domain-containing protein [Methylobacterium sp. Leaf118]
MREPGPHHRITITGHDGLVRVRANGRIIAETRRALRLSEAGYPPVLYIPRADVAEALCRPSPKRSFCPYKGEARYFGLEGGIAEIAWSYEAPFPAVARIRGHLAFDPDRVEAIEA